MSSSKSDLFTMLNDSEKVKIQSPAGVQTLNLHKPCGTFFIDTAKHHIFAGYFLGQPNISSPPYLYLTVLDKKYSNPKVYIGSEALSNEKLFKNLGLRFSSSRKTLTLEGGEIVAHGLHPRYGGTVPAFAVTLDESMEFPSCDNTKFGGYFENALVVVVGMGEDAHNTSNLLPNVMSSEETGHVLRSTVFNESGEYGIYNPVNFTRQGAQKGHFRHYMVAIYPDLKTKITEG